MCNYEEITIEWGFEGGKGIFRSHCHKNCSFWFDCYSQDCIEPRNESICLFTLSLFCCFHCCSSICLPLPQKKFKTTHDLVHLCKDPIARLYGVRFSFLWCSVVIPNTYFSGLKYVSPTFSIAMSNAVPALSFFFAWIFRMEKVDIRRFSSQAKIFGTAVTVGGAMVMTFVGGPNLRFPWTKGSNSHNHPSTSSTNNNQDSFKGVILVTISCLCSSVSCILQAIVLKSYPVGLIVTVLVCIVGVVEGSVVALAMEWKNPAAWSIHFDFQLLAILYAGILISGLSYYVQGVVMEDKGPVFLTAFFPLTTIIVAIISSFAVFEILSLGKIVGAVVIIIGLYLVLWGKTKDQATDKPAQAIDNVDRPTTTTEAS